jgi:hypothetical protein
LYFFVFFFWAWPAMRANASKVQPYKIVLIAVFALAVFIALHIYLLLYNVAPARDGEAKPAPPREPPPGVQKADAPLVLAKGISRGT